MKYVIEDSDGNIIRYGVNTNGAPQALEGEVERELSDEEDFPRPPSLEIES